MSNTAQHIGTSACLIRLLWRAYRGDHYTTENDMSNEYHDTECQMCGEIALRETGHYCLEGSTVWREFECHYCGHVEQSAERIGDAA